MLIDPPIADLASKVDCRYTLVVLAAKRARDLVQGSQPMVTTQESKPVSIAVQEIMADRIAYDRARSLLEGE